MDWDQVSFRSALDDLAAAGDFDLLLDRRVDPDRLFSAKIQNQPLQAGLDQVAGAEQLGVSQLGGLVYVGPSDAAARLRTLAVLRGNELQRLPPDARAPWETVATWSWPRLSEPRALLEELAAESGIELAGLERIPHDLWLAGQLPPLSVADRLTLLANEFDLTYRVSADGRRAELIPLPAKIQLARRYPGGRDAETLAAEWRERSPQATIKVQAAQITVSGLLEDHERLAQRTPPPKAPATTAPVDPSLVRNRLEIKSLPLGGVIEGLAKKLSLKVEMDSAAVERAGISLGQPISIDVKDATTEQLWQAILEPVGLTFTIEENVLRIAPK